jgi:opacity protein-like surface antigen
MKNVIVTALVLLCVTGVYAQDTPKIEITADYSFMRFNPQNNNIIKPFSLNGGGGDVAFFFNKYIGVKAEFEGYGSQTRGFTFPAADCDNEGDACVGNVQANLFTYNVGPIVKFRTSHFEPFVEAMFGGAHSNVYGNLIKECPECVVSKSPSNNAFDFQIGGGIDIPVTSHVAIRAGEFDYVLTRFGNNFTGGNNNQSSYRFQAGLQFRF